MNIKPEKSYLINERREEKTTEAILYLTGKEYACLYLTRISPRAFFNQFPKYLDKKNLQLGWVSTKEEKGTLQPSSLSKISNYFVKDFLDKYEKVDQRSVIVTSASALQLLADNSEIFTDFMNQFIRNIRDKIQSEEYTLSSMITGANPTSLGSQKFEQLVLETNEYLEKSLFSKLRNR